MTVAVLTHNERRQVRSLLPLLAGQLQPGDDLVLVGPYTAPGEGASWREVRRRGELAKPATRPPLHDLVILLDDRVLPGDGLVEALVEAAADSLVGAVGARSNVACGEELLVGLPCRPSDAAGRRALLRSRAATQRGLTTRVAALGGPCLLLRRRHLERAGGLAVLAGRAALRGLLDPARADGLHLVVAEAAYVHHPGGIPRLEPDPAWPLVSACLIVKDEEEQLEACLTSAKAIADELVVYDTGSSDGTRDLATRLGAEVVEGYWDDDFARARNAALDHCRGQWILWLDADETLVCDDPAALRAQLHETPSEIEGLLVLIDNLQGTEAATVLTHPAARLFRRGSCQWEGRLHEQVMRRAGPSEPQLALQKLARITHRGYLQAAMRERGKGVRNLRTAFSDLGGGSTLDRATRALSLGRSYLLAGRFEEGVELVARARALAERGATVRLALRALCEGYLALGRADDALAAAFELREESRVPALADVMEGRARLALGDPEGALASFERLEERGAVIDDDGFEYRPNLVADGKASALVQLGRSGEAADVLLRTLRDDGGLDSHVGLLIEALELAGRDLGEIYDDLPPGRLGAFVPQLVQLQAEPADRALEAWHGRDPASLPILAAAAEIAPRLPISRQLMWSARLRQAGLPDACPLVASTTSPAIPASDRALGAAVAWASFADKRACAAFGACVLQVAPEERPLLQSQIAALAPALLERLERLAPLSSATDPPGPEPRPATGRRVVVIGRLAAAPRARGLALLLAQRGHQVTLLQPEPAPPSDDDLSRHGVVVRTWVEASADHWPKACLSALARRAALEPVDALVLGDLAKDVGPEAAELLPGVPILLDGPETPLLERALVALSSSPPATPVDARVGICLLTSLRDATGAEPAWLGALLREIQGQLPAVPVSRCGDDPASRLRQLLPGVIDAGALGDGVAWLRAARVAVVAHSGDDRGWEALANACGTPTVIVATGDDVGPALERIGQLLLDPTSVDAVQPSAPRPGPATGEPIPVLLDPLAGLAETPTRPPAPPQRATAERVRVLLSGAGPGDAAPLAVQALARTLADLPVDLVEGPAAHGEPEVALEIALRWPPAASGASPHPVVAVPELERGGLPAEWIPRLRDQAAQCWVPSAWARRRALACGLPEDQVHVVPPGIDDAVYAPEGERRRLSSTGKVRLLFVGPVNQESGIDALVEAWVASCLDETGASLVLAALPPSSATRDDSLEQALDRLAAAGDLAIEVVRLRHDEDRGSLYRACDVLVHPYRDDPSGIVVAEAMACGLPVIVTEGLASEELCGEEVGWLVAARTVPTYRPGWTPTVGGFAWNEPSRASLGSAMRAAVLDETSRRQRAAAVARSATRAGRAEAVRAAAARCAALLPGSGDEGGGALLAPAAANA